MVSCTGRHAADSERWLPMSSEEIESRIDSEHRFVILLSDRSVPLVVSLEKQIKNSENIRTVIDKHSLDTYIHLLEKQSLPNWLVRINEELDPAILISWPCLIVFDKRHENSWQVYTSSDYNPDEMAAYLDYFYSIGPKNFADDE